MSRQCKKYCWRLDVHCSQGTRTGYQDSYVRSNIEIVILNLECESSNDHCVMPAGVNATLFRRHGMLLKVTWADTFICILTTQYPFDIIKYTKPATLFKLLNVILEDSKQFIVCWVQIDNVHKLKCIVWARQRNRLNTHYPALSGLSIQVDALNINP